MLKIYKASAGSGKTYTLVQQYIGLLFDAFLKHENSPFLSPHSRILAVTFTKKATAEMKERILKELYLLATNSPKAVLKGFLEQKLSISSEKVSQIARQLLCNLVQDYSHFAVNTIDSFFQTIVRSFARELSLSANYEISLDEEEIVNEAVMKLLKDIIEGKFPSIEAILSQKITDEINQDKTWNITSILLNYAKELNKEKLKKHLPAFQKLDVQSIIQTWKKHSENNETLQVALKDIDYLPLILSVYDSIKESNKEHHRLPISEVNHLLNQIIKHADTPFIYEKIGNRIQHYMIDEFQDTSAMQWENFRPLVQNTSSSGLSNLVVGDVKQSIYRFRNSDWHLLNEQIQQDIEDTRPITLENNYRSAKTIVEQNNALFPALAKKMQEVLEEKQGTRTDIYSEQGVKQVPQSNITGLYHVEVINQKNKPGYEKMVLERLQQTLEDIQKRYQNNMGKVAILVKKNSEVEKITQNLLEWGYEVYSTEGLAIDSHPVIDLLIAILTYNVRPQNVGEMSVEKQTILQLLEQKEDTWEVISRAKSLPLYEQIQFLIEQLHLYDWENASTYLVAFHDRVFDFIQTHSGDVSAFLEYWELKKQKWYISSVKGTNAIEVMTIHKSKGLEWDIVILPFVNWTWVPNKKPIIWCQAPESMPSEIPIIPIKYPNKAENVADFQQDIEDEKRNMYVDCLNLTYVAFTRASKELYAFVPYWADNKNGSKGAPRYIGNLIGEIYLKGNKLEDGENQPFTFGEKMVYEAKNPQQTNVLQENLQMYPTQLNDRLRLRMRPIKVAEQGTLMHEWLSRMTYLNDRKKALQEMLEKGYITQNDVDKMNDEMDKFERLIEQFGIKEWFEKNDYQIYNERDILLSNGRTERPDRVLEKGDEVIIIDYKFGKKAEKHKTQVKNYMNLYEKMGKKAQGYIIYVEQETITEVK